MLKVEKLTKEYSGPAGSISVLDDLDLEVAKGESVAIVGPSGCGKTTLLNILGTLDIPTGGSVSIGGHAVETMSVDERTRFRNRSLGFVFQQHFLLPQCTVLENVLMPRLAGDWEESEQATRERTASLLDGLGLGQRVDRMPYQLSGGERLRVAVARALANEPSLILADEPTGSLDPAMGEQVADLFAELNDQHQVTLVTVTHNAALAKRMGSVYVLKNGKLERE
ncbi:MAG: ABC transporter ATP-binding protein [Opitutales bacterium]|jgi:lipoprotein-releasing system ATP-binding protein|nr:ABC transporter ATP-binding protein [Opitutales bacterium]MBT5167701.1 ABC transporter ATP-binding protein [Opitutales bacterium]MBT5816371.1 ABC transporter ATP-binding protein [Opitutales bacterium]MBT6379498.1 ABC transporter ATP-binding protein [Opitutales bacterium]MBT6770766.1 ABC transporter ATP-binding protein [Opitutales bacterium]